MPSFNGFAQFHAEDPAPADLTPFPGYAPSRPEEPGATGWASAYSVFPDRESAEADAADEHQAQLDAVGRGDLSDTYGAAKVLPVTVHENGDMEVFSDDGRGDLICRHDRASIFDAFGLIDAGRALPGLADTAAGEMMVTPIEQEQPMTELRRFVCIFRQLNTETHGLRTFPCMADHEGDARERCMAQGDDCRVVAVIESDDPQGALEDYFSELLKTGSRVIVRRSDEEDNESALITGVEGGRVFLEPEPGRLLTVRRDSISASRPAVGLEELQAELEKLTQAARFLIDDTMMQMGDKSGDCQRMQLINELMGFEQAVNGITEADIKPTLGDGSAVMALFEFQPEAIEADNFVTIDAPDGLTSTWEVPLYEVSRGFGKTLAREDLEEVWCGHLDFVRHLGNAPAWVRAWTGPFTVKLTGFA